MRYRCPHCPVECEIIDGEIIPCADHSWAEPVPILQEMPLEEVIVPEETDGLLNS